jgi:hypothetical protein
MIKTENDYQDIIDTTPAINRIFEPRLEQATYKKQRFGNTVVDLKGGCTLILRRRDS